MLPVLPLGFLSFRTSWGLLTLLTLAVLVVSIPPSANRKLWWLQVILLATAKVQEVWLLLLVVAHYILKTWSPRRWLAAGALVTIVVALSILWFGLGWWTAMTSISQLDRAATLLLLFIDLPYLFSPYVRQSDGVYGLCETAVSPVKVKATNSHPTGVNRHG
jgi:hypothetical protein